MYLSLYFMRAAAARQPSYRQGARTVDAARHRSSLPAPPPRPQETWAGPIGGSASGEAALPTAPKLSSLPRATPRGAGGVWNVFVRGATPISEEEARARIRTHTRT